jgi:hypothetical protein
VTEQSVARPVWVIRPERVREAIDALTARSVHPFFPAYLQIRKTAVEQGIGSGIRPHWEDVGSFLRVEGGPPGKPYFRPLFTRAEDFGRYWMGTNLAGMWAPSSLRQGMPPREVVDTANSAFTLRDAHAELALQHLLFGQPVDVMALAIFFFRDYGFYSDESEREAPNVTHVVDLFLRHFAFRGLGSDQYEPGDVEQSDSDLLFDQGESRWLREPVLHQFQRRDDPESEGA